MPIQSIGLGGRYGFMKTIVSKNNIIDSDHFPPKSIFASARDANIKALSADSWHRKLITTGTVVGQRTVKGALIEELCAFFRAGN